jgi:protein-arginine kinase activator protein McsA
MENDYVYIYYFNEDEKCQNCIVKEATIEIYNEDGSTLFLCDTCRKFFLRSAANG